MLFRLVVAVVLVVAAVVVARVIRSRRPVDPPTVQRRELPSQLSRSEFESAATDWLVVVFTSDTCSTCADVVNKARVLESDAVGVQIVSYQGHKNLHQRYDIDAVPLTVIADHQGTVQAGFIGPVTATDLWAALADARAPGSTTPEDQ